MSFWHDKTLRIRALRLLCVRLLKGRGKLSSRSLLSQSFGLNDTATPAYLLIAFEFVGECRLCSAKGTGGELLRSNGRR